MNEVYVPMHNTREKDLITSSCSICHLAMSSCWFHMNQKLWQTPMNSLSRGCVEYIHFKYEHCVSPWFYHINIFIFGMRRKRLFVEENMLLFFTIFTSDNNYLHVIELGLWSTTLSIYYSWAKPRNICCEKMCFPHFLRVNEQQIRANCWITFKQDVFNYAEDTAVHSLSFII